VGPGRGEKVWENGGLEGENGGNYVQVNLMRLGPLWEWYGNFWEMMPGMASIQKSIFEMIPQPLLAGGAPLRET
jgi:hypothetical protein